MNLLKETIEEIESNGKKVDDVLWCGSKDFYCHWDEFKEIINIDYDCGFGGKEVAEDLIVVGEDWWLERHEYDGSEWWEFKSLPKKPDVFKSSFVVTDDRSWLSLKEKNK
jgi:hypothetical protein